MEQQLLLHPQYSREQYWASDGGENLQRSTTQQTKGHTHAIRSLFADVTRTRAKMFLSALCALKRQLYRFFISLYLFFFADASQYAHYVFKTFKNGNETGTINFEVLIIYYTATNVINGFFYAAQSILWMTMTTRISNYMCLCLYKPIFSTTEEEDRVKVERKKIH